MIDISDVQKSKIINELIDTKIDIIFPDGDCATITGDNISAESLKLKQAISDGSTLKFGGCIASEFNIDLINTSERTFDNSLVGKWISVRLTQTFPSGDNLLPTVTLLPSATLLSGETTASHEWYIFSGYIDSAKVNKSDKNMRNVIAYDVFAKLHQQDGTSLLMSVLKSHSDGYNWLRNLLLIVIQSENVSFDYANWCSFMDEVTNESKNSHVYSYQILNDSWLNDNNTISKGEIIRCICEMMGTFGVIKPDSGKGTFMIVALGDVAENFNYNENLYAEEYKSLGYTNFVIANGNSNRTDKTMNWDYPAIDEEQLPPAVNYDLSKNACCWQSWDGSGESKSCELFYVFSHNTGLRFYNSAYTPLTATVDGRLWVEVGDKITITTNKTDVNGDYVTDSDGNVITENIESYILSRTLSGIHALADEIEAKGGN